LTSDNTQAAAIRQYASRLFKPEELIEYRAKGVDGSFRGLYFTDQNRLAEVVAALDSSGRATVSYVCINPLKQRLIRERNLLVNPTDEQVNQIMAGPPGKTARDEDIEIIRWMFVDVDTVRVPHLLQTDKKEFDRLQHECSTDEEKAKAQVVAQKVLKFLRGEKGWPQPLLCDSGNGFHILFHINLQNTPFNVNQVADCLKALKQQFAAEPDADIDSSVYNPARLTRAYGSTTRKGTDTPERPYRQNRILSTSPVGDVTLDMILGLAVQSPGYSKHSDGDMPELDEKFDKDAYFQHYEAQGAYHIVGEKEWQGNPIWATDVCLFQGHHHSGDEYKSGFIFGNTLGYKCFSSDCEGLGIKDVNRILHKEILDEQGNPKYKPYPGVIYKTDTLEELKEEFGWVLLEDWEEEQKAKVEALSVDAAPAPEPTVEPGEPDINKNRLKADRVKEVAGWMTGALLRDPIGNLPKFRLIKSHISSTLMERVEAPILEALTAILGYFEDTHMLPSRAELVNWMNESSHGVARLLRGKDYFNTVRDYIVNLQDDLTKEFAPMAVELDRATKLASQRQTTKTNYDKHLHPQTGDGDVQAFRIAERQHAQKELRSRGEIVGKPLQQMTEEISLEFLKDVEGANDAGKVELGFSAIDHHSHIGLNGERTICIYGPANVGKTTLLMTIAVNMAMSGKNVLILIGEHQAIPMMKTLTLMLGPTVKDDPEIGVLPDRNAWEGINPKATREDWERINRLLKKLRDRELLPGWLGVENISAIAGIEEDRLGACVDYIHSFHMTYPLDAVIIDPLDQVMPLSAMGQDNKWQEGEEVLQRIQNLSRTFEGHNGKGLMIITSVQFTSKMQREIEKNQAKTAIGDNMDDVILSLMEQTSQIQFYTTIPQVLDMMIGIVTRLKRGREGYLYGGRSRFASTFKQVSFVMDPVAHIITTTGAATYTAVSAAAAPDGNRVEQSMEAYDTL